METIFLSRKIQFSSGFKKLDSPSSEGANFELQAWFTGPVDPETDLVINIQEMDTLLKDVVSDLDFSFLSGEGSVLRNFSLEAFGSFLSQRLQQSQQKKEWSAKVKMVGFSLQEGSHSKVITFQGDFA